MEFNRGERALLVTSVGFWINLVLTIVKYAAGFTAHSGAMIADATHSLSDLVTDVVVFFGFKVVNKPADKDHRYGHGKVETLLASLCGVVLFVAGTGILLEAAHKIIMILRGEALPRPGMLALGAAFLSIVVKELLYRYTAHWAKNINSPALLAKAWDHRSDAFSSIGVLFGIAGARFLGGGGLILDPIAAAAVSFFIIRISLPIMLESLNELLEGALDRETEERIIALIRESKEIREVHHLRTRRVGPYIAMETHVLVDRSMSLVEAHYIASVVEDRLHQEFGPETLISLHVEPLPERGKDHVDDHVSENPIHPH